MKDWTTNTTEDNFTASVEKLLGGWRKQWDEHYKNNNSISHGNVKVSSKQEEIDQDKPFKDYIDECVRIKKESLNELGVKHNKNKVPLDKVLTTQFPKSIQALALCTFYGHTKYPQDIDYLNFKRVKGGSQTYADAGARHNMERDKEDVESGLPHQFLKLWNAMAETELWIEENSLNIKEFSHKYLAERNK